MSQQGVCLLPMITSGGEEMVKGDKWHEIHSRFKLKETRKSIARSLGLDVRTVRKILRQSQPLPYRREGPAATLLTPYEGHIRQRLPAVGWCAQSIFEELQAMGYPGGYATVRRFVRPLREEATRQATVRFETSKVNFFHPKIKEVPYEAVPSSPIVSGVSPVEL